MLLDVGVGEIGNIERAREVSRGFGRFVMEPELLYESPFIDVAPTGPEKLLGEE